MADDAIAAYVFEVGEHVANRGSDYRFVGLVVARFRKKNGAPRYVAENEDGILHIFSAKNLEHTRPTPADATVKADEVEL